jgi:SSS family solute:Na+ symporter
LSPLDHVVVATYLAGMLAIGVLVSRRIGSFDDFFVAGGRMTTPLLVCTLVSTYYGLDVTFGSSETAYLEGMAAFFAYSAPFYLAYVATALWVTPRLKRVPARSLPEAMGHFYGPPARLAAALASFVYSAPILSVVGMGLIGRVFLGWPVWVAAVIGAVIALVYTVLGGLLADALTDTVQFVAMCVSAAIAAAIAMTTIGAPAEIGARLGGQVLAPLGGLSPWEVAVFGLVALTPLVEPVFYQRTFAAVSARQMVRALLLGVVLWAAYDWLVIYLGLVGADLVAAGTLPASLDESEIILHVAAHLLPAGLLGLFVAGCLASAMSTIDSYTLVAAGNLVYDGWQVVRRRELPDRTLLRATRVCAGVTLAVALALGLSFERLRDAWIFMSTVLLSTTLVPMLAALGSARRPPARAGQWGAVAGLAAALALFAAFQIFGQEAAGEGTTALVFGFHRQVRVEREAALLVTLPVSLLAFMAGWWRGREEEAGP